MASAFSLCFLTSIPGYDSLSSPWTPPLNYWRGRDQKKLMFLETVQYLLTAADGKIFLYSLLNPCFHPFRVIRTSTDSRIFEETFSLLGLCVCVLRGVGGNWWGGGCQRKQLSKFTAASSASLFKWRTQELCICKVRRTAHTHLRSLSP